MRSEEEDRSLWGHPHYGDPRVDPEARKGRTPLSPAEGSSTKEKPNPRRIGSRGGTVLYAATNDADGNPRLPHNPQEAARLRVDMLTSERYLSVSERSVGPGKKGQDVIRRLGVTPYGAFIEVDIPRRTERGEQVIDKRYVSLLNRIQR